MNEFIEKLIGRLEEERAKMEDKRLGYEYESPWKDCCSKVKEIVNQLAEEYKPKTRADKIRSMNDEELAEFINGFSTICELCNLHAGCCNVENTKCKNGILEWLQSEAE